METSFEEVADWCERYLEARRGREIGMTFGAMIRAYGRLAATSPHPKGEKQTARQKQLDAKAEKLLLELSKRFLVAYGWVESKPGFDSGQMMVNPKSMRTNMIYDPGKRAGK